MLMHNFLEYGDNYSMVSGGFWNYYRNKVNDNANENVDNYRINNTKQQQVDLLIKRQNNGKNAK